MGIIMRLIRKLKRKKGSNQLEFPFRELGLEEERLEEIAEDKARQGLKSDDDFELPEIDLPDIDTGLQPN